MMSEGTPANAATRGPAKHAVRDQIIEAANDCFAHYGYNKTTVADLAREIGFSKAYIYRFFASKQAIGEAICEARLAQILTEARRAVDEEGSAADRFRRMFRSITKLGVALFFDDRKIYEIAALAASERWGAARAYSQSLQDMIMEIIRQGRVNGEFERKTPLDETARSIYYAMTPFVDPRQLGSNLDLLPQAQDEVTALILRSLAP